jgi:putative sterol carrier protein
MAENKNKSRFAVLKDLTKAGKASPPEALQHLSQLLEPAKLHGTLQVQIAEGGTEKTFSSYSIIFGKKKTKPGKKAAANRAVELIMTQETWTELSAGRLAPHDAFLGGRMRVRGSASFAQSILKHAAGSDGATTLCEDGTE